VHLIVVLEIVVERDPVAGGVEQPQLRVLAIRAVR